MRLLVSGAGSVGPAMAAGLSRSRRTYAACRARHAREILAVATRDTMTLPALCRGLCPAEGSRDCNSAAPGWHSGVRPTPQSCIAPPVRSRESPVYAGVDQ